MAPKTFRTTKKILMPPGASHASVVMERPFWTEAYVVKVYFWVQFEKNKAEANIPFEQSSGSSLGATPRDHQTPLMDHKEGDWILIHPRSVLRMRVEKVEFCWSDVDFEAKFETSPSFAKWATALMAKKKYSDSIVSVGIGKALSLSKNLFINKNPMDLEFLISRWSIETHTFVTAWRDICPTIEDVVVLIDLPLFGEVKIIAMPGSYGVVLSEGDEVKLILLNEALSNSKA